MLSSRKLLLLQLQVAGTAAWGQAGDRLGWAAAAPSLEIQCADAPALPAAAQSPGNTKPQQNLGNEEGSLEADVKIFLGANLPKSSKQQQVPAVMDVLQIPRPRRVDDPQGRTQLVHFKQKGR